MWLPMLLNFLLICTCTHTEVHLDCIVGITSLIVMIFMKYLIGSVVCKRHLDPIHSLKISNFTFFSWHNQHVL
jgi:hypothetical protein